jgi:hypothetical protein
MSFQKYQLCRRCKATVDLLADDFERCGMLTAPIRYQDQAIPEIFCGKCADYLCAMVKRVSKSRKEK